MKKILSIYNLFFRSSALAVGITIPVSVCVQAAFLYGRMQSEAIYFESVVSGYTMLPSLLALILILWFTRDMLGSSKSRVDLTLRRLKVKAIPVFITEAVYIMMALTVFWALTAGVTYAMAAYFTDNISTAQNPEVRLLIAFYRCGPLHVLFPLRDGLRLACNIAAVLAFGFSMAAGNYFKRKGKGRDGLSWVTLCLFVWLSIRMYNESMMAVEAVSYGMVTLTAITFVAFEEKHPNEAEQKKDEGGEGTDEEIEPA